LGNNDIVTLKFRACTSTSDDSCGDWSDAIEFKNDISNSKSGWSNYKTISNGMDLDKSDGSVHDGTLTTGNDERYGITLDDKWIEVIVTLSGNGDDEKLMVDTVKIRSICDAR
jgi:hypothetical protein